MKKFCNALACAVLALFLASCQDAPPSTAVPQLTFDVVRAVSLDVARVEVADKYRPPGSTPHVEHLFKLSPAAVVRRMAQEKLVPQGSLDTLRVVIEDASVVRKDLPVTEGVAGLFHKEPSETYHARVVVRFERLDEHSGAVTGSATVTSERERTLLEDASPADRDMTFFRMTEDIMRDLDAEFSGIVRRTFGWKQPE